MKYSQRRVENALQIASETYLQEIVDHGIHNLTNDYHGDSDDAYVAFANEFKRQAQEQLENSIFE